MVRKKFNEGLEEIEQGAINIGEMVWTALNNAIDALIHHDLEEAHSVITNDVNINNKRWKVEERCITLIATQQPVATDLREIIAILNIITDFERMGDHAQGIAKVMLRLESEPPMKTLQTFFEMSHEVLSMIKRSIQALIDRDIKESLKIYKHDDVVDNYYNKIFDEILTYEEEKPKRFKVGTYFIWMAHDLERIADRVSNICERIVYLAHGEMENLDTYKPKSS
ncbi:MAG: phosphate signaling complex protein PhoU [Candidatus Cloacimonetes bacterium]|nr:phosphate signaling complex protein PhoU [Candidatus Cloacimonadota bacterium]MBS3767340.1 phosphate signaling complex protein PhoU [Candidatus Cloacimonadota bacterium]